MRSFDEMNRLFDEMNRSFDEFRMGWWNERPALESGSDSGFGTMPAVGTDSALSMEEGDGEYVLVMDLPGFDREEIDLTADDGELSVHAVRDMEEGSDTHRTMRSWRVARTIPVPGRVAREEITATYHNGVLEVRLPIEDGEDGHHIEIE